MELKLIKLSESDGEAIYEMLQEIPGEENGFMNPMNGCSFEEFKAWIEKSKAYSEEKELIGGWRVPETYYWLFEDSKPVGWGKIRHFLTPALLENGGHIGYAVRPSARGKGYGKELLRLLKRECLALGIDRALLTIHKDNLISKKAALANGGVTEKENDELYYIWMDC